MAVLLLLYDGSFWNLWSLHRNEKEMIKRIDALNEDVKALQFKVEAARSHSFIERQATEQLGLVREDELVFVFSDGE
jgi:cell division protein FtsB